MKIQTKEHFVKAGAIHNNTFNVQMNAKFFSTLYSTLYKNREEAVVRELFCNAIDSHQLRNKLWAAIPRGYVTSCLAPAPQAFSSFLAPDNKKIEIHLPNEYEPYLEIKDYGVGLSLESIIGSPVPALEYQVMITGNHVIDRSLVEDEGQIVAIPKEYNGELVFRYVDSNDIVRGKGLYTTLFDSTKENSNDQIGAFGLGSKSPFAVTDSFMVSSRYNGEEHNYLMFLDGNRIPAYDLMTKDLTTKDPQPKPTTEYNGLTVRVPIESAKYYQFYKELMRVCSVMEPHMLPEVSGSAYFSKFELISRENRVGNSYIQPVKGNFNDQTHYAVMGGVAYPIQLKVLPDLVQEILKTTPTTYTYFPLGDLNVPPSREDLSYDDYTLENLRGALTLVGEGFIEKLGQEIQEEQSIIRRWIKISDIKKQYGENIGKHLDNYMVKDTRFGKENILLPKIQRPEYNKSHNSSFYDRTIAKFTHFNDNGYKSEVNAINPISAKDGVVFVIEDNMRCYVQKMRKLVRTTGDKYVIMVCPHTANLQLVSELNLSAYVDEDEIKNLNLIREQAASWLDNGQMNFVKFSDKLYEHYQGIFEPEILFMSELEYDKVMLKSDHGIQNYSASYNHSNGLSYSFKPSISLKVLEEHLENGKRILYIPANGRQLDLPNWKFKIGNSDLKTLDEFLSYGHAILTTGNKHSQDSDYYQFLTEMGFAPMMTVAKKKSLPVLQKYPDSFVHIEDFIPLLVKELKPYVKAQHDNRFNKKVAELTQYRGIERYIGWFLQQLQNDQLIKESGDAFKVLQEGFQPRNIVKKHLSTGTHYTFIEVLEFINKVYTFEDKEYLSLEDGMQNLFEFMDNIDYSFSLDFRQHVAYRKQRNKSERFKETVRRSIERYRISKFLQKHYQPTMANAIDNPDTLLRDILLKDMKVSSYSINKRG